MKKPATLLMICVLLFSNTFFIDAVQFQLISTIPSAPSNLNKLTLTPKTVSLSWTDNSTNETGFKIERRTPSQFLWTELAQVSNNITTYEDKSLSPGGTYLYRVRAYNTFGNSSYSNELEITTRSLITINTPKAGTTINGSSTVNITWNIEGPHVTMFGNDVGLSLNYSTDGINYKTINYTDVYGDDGTYSWVVPNINSTNVTVNIMYLQSGGVGIPYYVSSSTLPFTIASQLKLAPIQPSNLSCQSISDNQINLEWDQCGDDKTAFIIERKTGLGAFSKIKEVASNVHKYNDVGLSANTKYTYRVAAKNNFTTSSYSNEANATTDKIYLDIQYINFAPSAPSNLLADPSSNSQVDLSWTASSKGASGYKIERKIEGGSYSQLAILGSTITDYSDTTVESGKVYIYHVKAYNTFGSSAFTNEAQVTVPDFSAVNLLPDPVVQPEADGIDYSTASGWAIPEIEEAISLNLTTDSILNDFQKNITREEFCEIVVKLYEALSGQTVTPISPNPFTDVTNPEVLKANRLGIVNGISADKFAPNNSISRQELCVMLLRTLKVAKPGQDYSSPILNPFADEADIASWAIEAIRFMNKSDIMKGTGNNAINPKGNTPREQAISLLKRTFETFK